MTEPISSYAAAGVDAEAADLAIRQITSRLRATWPTEPGPGQVQLDIGYFANVVDVGGIGLAMTTDGVGTKVIVAQMMDRYDTVGIDCVAMNVNDLLCVGATPISLVDYIAVQDANPRLIDEIMKGLVEGAKLAGVSIVGGEIAQLRETIAGPREGYAFDLAAAAVGLVPLDRMLVGQAVEEGDVVVGIESNGIHSNGLTLARQVLFHDQGYGVDTRLPGLEHSLGEELLRPTHIYVREVVELFETRVPVKALMHITGDGLLNLNRVAAEVGFVIGGLPPPPAVFTAIQRAGELPPEEMFRVFNMGVGFCIVVPPAEVDRVISVVSAHGKRAFRIGRAVRDPERRIVLIDQHLVGKGKRFEGA